MAVHVKTVTYSGIEVQRRVRGFQEVLEDLVVTALHTRSTRCGKGNKTFERMDLVGILMSKCNTAIRILVVCRVN